MYTGVTPFAPSCCRSHYQVNRPSVRGGRGSRSNSSFRRRVFASWRASRLVLFRASSCSWRCQGRLSRLASRSSSKRRPIPDTLGNDVQQPGSAAFHLLSTSARYGQRTNGEAGLLDSRLRQTPPHKRLVPLPLRPEAHLGGPPRRSDSQANGLHSRGLPWSRPCPRIVCQALPAVAARKTTKPHPRWLANRSSVAPHVKTPRPPVGAGASFD